MKCSDCYWSLYFQKVCEQWELLWVLKSTTKSFVEFLITQYFIMVLNLWQVHCMLYHWNSFPDSMTPYTIIIYFKPCALIYCISIWWLFKSIIYKSSKKWKTVSPRSRSRNDKNKIISEEYSTTYNYDIDVNVLFSAPAGPFQK